MSEEQPVNLTAGPATGAPPAPPIESRTLWLEIRPGMAPRELSQSIESAALAGFNSLAVPFDYGGYPLFPTGVPDAQRIRPILPELRKRDVLGEISDEAAAHGLVTFGVASLWRAHGEVPRRDVERAFARRDSWLSRPPGRFRNRDKAPDDAGVYFCPSDAERRRCWGEMLAEAIEAYPFAGLIFDAHDTPYSIRPGGRCFCDACEKRAREFGGLDLMALVEASSPSPENILQLERFQSASAQEDLAYYRRRLYRSRPGMPMRVGLPAMLAAEAGMPKLPLGARESYDFDSWREWLDSGAMDGLELDGFPHEAAALAGAFAKNHARWPGDLPIFPVLHPSDPQTCEAQVEVLREFPILGFTVKWRESDLAVSAETLAETLFQNPAIVAAVNPPLYFEMLLGEIAAAAGPDSGVREFLDDLTRFAREARGGGGGGFPALDAVADNLRGLEARAERGEVDFGDAAATSRKRIGQARRLARVVSHAWRPAGPPR